MKPPSVTKPQTWQLRVKLIGHFGGQCVDCGDMNPMHLQFDHANGGGQRQHMTQRGQRFYEWLQKEKVWEDNPPTIALRCANCHLEKTLRDAGVIPGSDEVGTQASSPAETGDANAVVEPMNGGCTPEPPVTDAYAYRNPENWVDENTVDPAPVLRQEKAGRFSRFFRGNR